ncbi:MAG TPA: DUF4157 domain-containing protein [Kofleriaceae bacterium]|nr:DUF4157 domain-containing protein [Kofleriaceae bacterium]
MAMDRIQLKQIEPSTSGVQAKEIQAKEIQAKPGGNSQAADLHDTAAQGVAGGGGPLPHLDQIQQSFGKHDVSGVQAHTGGAAAAATSAMGAEAYATGNNVAFGGGSPSLHTAAHEAAHVVQQRGGVQLKGGVGEVGDAYEQHADAVADQVVQGKSAEGLLDQHAGSGGSGGGAVQHKALQFEIKADLRKAMAGWGSDENAIFARLQQATAAELAAVIADQALMGELKSELSRANMEKVLDLLQAPITQKLQIAMDGWGQDEAYIFRTLNAAAPAELITVAGNAALMAQLKSELSRANMNRLLDKLNVPLTQKLQFAMEGWGCDDKYITDSLAKAPVADIVALAGNAPLLSQLQGELSGKGFDAIRGSMAHRIAIEGANPLLAWNLIRGGAADRATRGKRLLAFGSVAEQRAMLDAVIATTTDLPAGIQAFESYWNIDLGAQGAAWTIPVMRQVHAQCKTLPEGDVRNGVFSRLTLITGSGGSMDSRGEFQLGAGAATAPAQPYGVGTTLAGNAAASATVITVKDPAVFTAGATVSVGHGTPNADVRVVRSITGTNFTLDTALTHAHSMYERVTPNDQTAIADVAWLPAVVRHEIAHSVDTALGGSVRTGFSHGLGGFDSGVTFDAWAALMGNPWTTNDGSAITQPEKDEIKTAIDTARKGSGGQPLNQGLARTHAINKYWTKGVPVIEAAKPCIAAGQTYWYNPEVVQSFGGRRFAINLYYKEFQFYNEQVHAQRVRDYAIFAPAEFFAEVYTVFYEQVGTVPDAQLGARVPVSSWRDWIRTNVHNRGMAPAAPSATPAGHPAGAPAGDSTVAQRGVFPSAGFGKSAMNSGHV